MKNFDTLIGLQVDVYMDTQSVGGILEHIDEEKIILNDGGIYFMIFKSKVNMVCLNPEDIVEIPVDQPPRPEYHVPMERIKQPKPEPLPPIEEEEEFIANGVAEDNQYGSILPRTLLEQQPKNPAELFAGELSLGIEEDDFSISVGILRNEEGLLSRAERKRIMEETKREISDGSTE